MALDIGGAMSGAGAGYQVGGPWGAVAGGVLGALSGGGGSAKRAAAAAAATANDMTARAERQARADLAPYRTGGQAATSKLTELMGLDNFDRDAIASELRKSNPGLFAEQATPESRARVPGSLSYQLYGPGTEYNVNGNWQSASGEFTQPYTDAQNKAIDDAIAEKKGSSDYGALTKEFSLNDYVADPGYQFRLDEGNKAIERAQAKRGNFYSGAALKEADRYNSGQASQEYGSAYDRYQTNKNTIYNRLAGISNTGIGAANTGIQVGQNSAGAYGTIAGQLANATAAANQSSQANRNQGFASLADMLKGGGSSSYTKLPWMTAGNVNPQGGYY